MNSEALIIGGGIIGLGIARSLAKTGFRRITVVERGEAGREASYAAAGMLAPQSESDADDAMFRLCSKSRDLYPLFAAELLAETGIDIELEQSGTLVPVFDDDDEKRASHAFAWQSAAGLKIEKLSAEEMLQMEPMLSPDVRGGLFFPNDWQVDNRKAVAALLEYARHHVAINILENKQAHELIVRSGKCIGARCGADEFFADAVIVAAGAWTSFMKICGHEFPLDVEPVRGQMICFEPPERSFRRVIFSSKGYIVPRRSGRLVAGSTAEHCGFEDRTTDEGIEKIRQNAVRVAPFLGDLAIADSWSGLRPRTNDGLPVIGKFSDIDGLFVATAHFRNGILLAPLTAEIIAAKIASGEHSAELDIFSPERKELLRAAA
jgi:glycine oxidase